MNYGTPVRPYIFYRGYCIAVVLAWNVTGFARMARNEPPGWEWVVMFPLIFPAIFMIFSAGAFRFQYSAFGPRVRTPLPSQQPLESASSGGIVGWANASTPFITWMVYPAGVGFRFIGIGKGFVPFSNVTKFRRGIFGGCVVYHNNQEIRSPLRIPSWKIRRALEAAMGGVT